MILQNLEKSDDLKSAAKNRPFKTKKTVNNQARAQVFKDFLNNSKL